MEESCTSNGQSSGGVPISVSQWRSTWCEGRAGEWNCECYGAQSNNLQISFSPSANGITACREAREYCEGEIDFDGPLQCERDSQSVSNDYCEAGLRCYRETAVDGATVSVNGWAWTWCERMSDGTLDCRCDGMGIYEGFSVAGDDPWDSCQEAGDVCARIVEGSD